ncbi:MAG: hypothetical protein K2X66_16245, partial [Cyanobacteria bacterium]|nr:hypothetical protein [Cyanobacteriota bacterium]
MISHSSESSYLGLMKKVLLKGSLSMAISGFATSGGTRRFCDRFESSGAVSDQHFRITPQGLVLSSLGMGSYLGNPDAHTDMEMVEATKLSVESGAINVLDTAINYRYQNSERSIGKALGEMIEAGRLQRDEVFVCSKNGFLTTDAAVKEEFQV